MHFRLIALVFLAFFGQSVLAAEWLEAESERYIVTGKLDADKLRDIVQDMEEFDQLLEAQFPPQTRPQRKMRIFLEEDARVISKYTDLQVTGQTMVHAELLGSHSQFRTDDATQWALSAVLHAQTSIYIDNAFTRPSPWWVKQGGALFLSTVYKDEEGRFLIGAPDVRRPLTRAVTPKMLSNMVLIERTPRSQSQFIEYSMISREAATVLLINPENSGLMEAYLNAFEDGVPHEEAGRFLGDFDAIARQINRRASSNTKSLLQFPLPGRQLEEITVRSVPNDEVALIGIRFQRLADTRRRSTARTLSRLTEDYPESAPVWYEYAAAEFARVQEADFGGEPVFRGFGFSNGELIVSSSRYSDAKAWEAVNRALALDSGFAPAIRLKAEILMARLVRATDGDVEEGFDEVRAMLAPLAQDPERNPLAAAVLFQSYIEQDIPPPAPALNGLGRAFVSNPGVEAFRYAYAVALARNGERETARRLLISMLNHPEYRDAAERALEQAP